MRQQTKEMSANEVTPGFPPEFTMDDLLQLRHVGRLFGVGENGSFLPANHQINAHSLSHFGFLSFFLFTENTLFSSSKMLPQIWPTLVQLKTTRNSTGLANSRF